MSHVAQTLTIRKLEIDLERGFARHWNGNDRFRTAFFNALSMSFPAGEQTFIDAVRTAASLLPATEEAETMRATIKRFIGQEATHGRIHTLYNAQLAQQGLINRCEYWIAKRVARSKRRNIAPIHMLAITAAYEHCTSVFSDGALKSDSWFRNADPRMTNVWRWHCSEEIEHKAVAFDLYQTLGGSNRARIGWFLYALMNFSGDAICQTTMNLWHDKALFKVSTWISAARFFLGREGFVWRCGPALACYLKRDFHPDQENNRALSAQWLAEHASILRSIS